MCIRDRAKSAWIPANDGRVIKVLRITNGLAELDTTGNGTADNGATLGVTDAERQQLATLYAAGKTVWRVPLTHLSTYDCNYGVVPVSGATAPQLPPPPSDAVSYTHLDVYKRQPLNTPWGLTARQRCRDRCRRPAPIPMR